jgi:hypothetical protein
VWAHQSGRETDPPPGTEQQPEGRMHGPPKYPIHSDARTCSYTGEAPLSDQLIEAQARAIVDHCGLPWEDACLGFYQTRREVKTASSVQVRMPVYRTSVGRWRPYENFLQPLIEALNVGMRENVGAVQARSSMADHHSLQSDNDVHSGVEHRADRHADYEPGNLIDLIKGPVWTGEKQCTRF